MNFGKYIAHRGLHGEYPENSLGAFSYAVEKNFAIELDVRLTKDCKMVVFHDKDLMRVCGVDVNVSDFTYEQLSLFKLGESNEKIPLLADVLKLVDGKVPLLIEIKNGSPFWVLEKRLARMLKKYKGEYVVESFNPFSLFYFRIFSPSIERGQLISTYKNKLDFEYIARKICAVPLVWKLFSQPNFVAGDLRSVSMETLFAVLDSGADYVTWTAKNDELIETAKQFSKTVIFENYANMSHDFSDNWEDYDESNTAENI